MFVKIKYSFVKNLNLMKHIFFVILIALTTVANATNYYISPNGNDSNNGTITSPFFTLNKAWSVVKAGDIIYVRGGLYKFNSRQNLTDKSGTESDTIRIWAYPGEKPVFTKSSSFTNPNWPVSLVYVKANYIHIKGIEVTRFTQATSTIWYGIALQGANHNKLENINSHHNGHGMVIRDESGNNLVLNCDFHHNYDPLTSNDPYGNADGLEVGYQSSSMVNTIKNCRIYNNSDDGIDLWDNNGNVIIDGCWSWNNGYREDGRTKGGDGGGFKFGKTSTGNGSEFKRTIKNNVSVYNRTRGFNQNDANVRFYFYNNIAYKNLDGIDFSTNNLSNIYRNNVSFGNSSSNWKGQYSTATKDHNSYDPLVAPSGPKVTSADFQSVDTTGMAGPRQADGSLPSLRFLKLVSGSGLVDTGVDVGTSYAGSAPDLGAFEFRTSVSTPAPAPAPATKLEYVSSAVNKSVPAEIDVLFSSALTTTLPSASAFEVKINSTVATISKLAVSEKTLLVTLSTTVKAGDEITFSYTKPETNPLLSATGTASDTFTGKSVTNPLEPAAAPVFVSSATEDKSADKIGITYDVKLTSALPATSAFVAKVNGQAKSVKSVVISENKVILTLPVTLKSTDTITVSYSKPTTNPLQSTVGGIAESFSDKSVTNNVAAVAAEEPVINDGKITIFPNPAAEFVTIANFNSSVDNAILRLYDFSGKLCQEIKLGDKPKNQKIPIDLKSGFYIAQLLIGTKVQYTQKLIVI